MSEFMRRAMSAEPSHASETDDDDQRYGSILDHLKEGFQVISPDWRYLYANDTVLAQGRTSRSELLGRKMWDVYPGIEQTPLFAVLERCMAQRTASAFENAFTFPDGQQGWFELRIEPVPEGLAILSMDITERKRLQAALAASQRMLREVTYAAAHDLQAPLRRVLFLTDPDDETHGDAETAMAHAHEAARAMHGRLAALVAYTEADRTEPARRVSPSVLLGSVLVITRRRVEALGGRLTADLPSRDLVIAPHPLLTAAASFLRNAVDYRRPGEPPEVELKLRLEGGECVLTVRDRGVGISAVHLPRIWQAFYRIGEVPHPGDGVGLSIARVAVEGAGGTVQVRSDRRTGSIFEARLPGRAALDVSTP